MVGMDITRVSHDRLSDKIVNQIINMIREGSLKPGDKLPNETILSEQFGVSRGILREALTRLQSQGYIRRKPKDGTYIQDDAQNKLMNESVDELLKKATYSDLLDFRETLELKMIERVIERAGDEEIEELFDVLGVADNEEIQHNMDHYFHYKLAQASRNIFFMNFIDTYYDLISEIANRSHRDQERRNQIAEEHLAIATAIANRDKAAARKAVLHHMRMVDKKIESMK
ncbi:FadR/GntR family transcriptional regulator [Alkaliphilus peptidifermentans]|uniref:GntR family transcriptional regulator, transcriptional repressor for pyruvate dehydrogenase complex n=1 Tax=Alkaliphilus peptidifermentans DSM 18978 TaxID=1120976 RepID=A0A1G5G131_9FIRM|nr:FadR/GntR family transcriptional regulator [Alkaliphilus peptidifermentans]SCY44880.1 GntR family transcriptional regulator, transcriptional repressor for pyruvate dehydrogenase complex [Alkaliphilus peptidifermentans DSM 18978]